jgi:hypothetical protein
LESSPGRGNLQLPAFEQHRGKAIHNEDFVKELDNPYWDWAITASFYAALHYVEGFFARKAPPVHSRNHEIRDDNVQRDPVLKRIYDEYRQLKDDSVAARYDARLTLTQADYEFSRKYLERIKSVILPTFPA